MLRMNIQNWINANPRVLFLTPLFVVFVFCAIFYLISGLGGWTRLARRFRTYEPFYGESWTWQSGQLRGWCNYNHCLTVGANEQSLYLAVQVPFGMFHPPLLIPWNEIDAQTGKVMFGLYDTAKLRLGSEERVTLRIYGGLVARVRQAAGPGWPGYAVEASRDGQRV
jgi:hypothetical protein